MLIAVHGVTVCGKDDERLGHFARCLAISGMNCVVPTLPRLADLQWDTSDVEALCDLVGSMSSDTPGRVGLIGFSYGASYALLAAARSEVASRVGFVIAVGAYHSFSDLYDGYLEAEGAPPREERELIDRIYLHLVLARRQPELFTEEVRAQIDSLLKRYCYEAPDEEKRRFYQEHLHGRELVRREHQHRDHDLLRTLSPAGKLSGLDCPVGLLHDPDDHLVPAGQAERLHEELRRLPGGGQHRLVVTPLMQHVTLSGLLKMRDVLRLFSILSPLAGAVPGGGSW
jgi:dipeptidyl aminopeptidase/acylaminoacyl peptidase